MDKQHILLLIDGLSNNIYSRPKTYEQKKIFFNYQSYENSALQEIKRYIIENDGDPISIMENFCHLMDDFSCSAKNGEASFMFSIYHDVAINVIDYLCIENGGLYDSK